MFVIPMSRKEYEALKKRLEKIAKNQDVQKILEKDPKSIEGKFVLTKSGDVVLVEKVYPEEERIEGWLLRPVEEAG